MNTSKMLTIKRVYLKFKFINVLVPHRDAHMKQLEKMKSKD